MSARGQEAPEAKVPAWEKEKDADEAVLHSGGLKAGAPRCAILRFRRQATPNCTTVMRFGIP